jgi:hypothetical protein
MEELDRALAASGSLDSALTQAARAVRAWRGRGGAVEFTQPEPVEPPASAPVLGLSATGHDLKTSVPVFAPSSSELLPVRPAAAPDLDGPVVSPGLLVCSTAAASSTGTTDVEGACPGSSGSGGAGATIALHPHPARDGRCSCGKPPLVLRLKSTARLEDALVCLQGMLLRKSGLALVVGLGAPAEQDVLSR